MALTFLDYTNRILKALNEVPLTSSDFATAIGFHAEAKDAVNAALYDFYTHENIEWSFLWSSYLFDTAPGTVEYARNAAALSIDWDSVYIKRRVVSVSGIVLAAGTATVTTSLPHLFQTGDNVHISGANQADYNGDFAISVTGPSTFTYTVSTAPVSPATGTIVAKSNTVVRKQLIWFDYDNYRQTVAERDENLNSNDYGVPDRVTEKQDGAIVITTVPDRIYEIVYEAFGIPTALVDYDDTSSMPAAYDQIIVDKALHYAYMFRDNLEQATLAEKRYMDGVNRMRKVYIPRQPNMRAVF